MIKCVYERQFWHKRQFSFVIQMRSNRHITDVWFRSNKMISIHSVCHCHKISVIRSSGSRFVIRTKWRATMTVIKIREAWSRHMYYIETYYEPLSLSLPLPLPLPLPQIKPLFRSSEWLLIYLFILTNYFQFDIINKITMIIQFTMNVTANLMQTQTNIQK